MADTPNPRAKGINKPPTPVLIGGGALVLLIILYVKSHKKEPAESNATPTADQGLTSQAFIPVTGENVAGAGASGFGNSAGSEGSTLAGVLGFEKESAVEGRQFQESQATALREYLNSQSTFNHELLSTIVGSQTGGGAPREGQVNSGGGTPTAPPIPAPVSSGSGGNVPMRQIKCPNGCPGHEYPKGKNGHGTRIVECQHKTSSKSPCVW